MDELGLRDRSLPVGAMLTEPTHCRRVEVLEAPGEWPYMAIWIAGGRIQMRYHREHSAALIFCRSLIESGKRPKLYCEEHIGRALTGKVIIEDLPETIREELAERRRMGRS